MGVLKPRLDDSNNRIDTVDPTATNDTTQGYQNGNIWINVTTPEAFMLLDSSPGAAVWTSITTGGVPVLPFEIASFTDNEAGTQLIGTGSAITSITFDATYDNGPATSGSVALITGTDLSGAFPVPMLGPTFTTSGATVVDLQYPASVGGLLRFRLTAMAGADSDTADETITYINQIRRGVMTSPLPSPFTQSDIDTFLTTSTLQNTLDISYIAASGAGEFDVIAFRDALGTPLLQINGFVADPTDNGTLSWTNANGFTETYHVYSLPQENQTGALIEWSTPP